MSAKQDLPKGFDPSVHLELVKLELAAEINNLVHGYRRDLFASIALQVYLERRNQIPGRERGTIAEVCQSAWVVADEMLAADPENTRAKP